MITVSVDIARLFTLCYVFSRKTASTFVVWWRLPATLTIAKSLRLIVRY